MASSLGAQCPNISFTFSKKPLSLAVGLGLNPLVDDRNGAQLSLPLTGVSGYTNLECYLNALADARVNAAMDVYFANGFE